MTTLNIDDIAPDFTMPIKDGTEITLSKLKGKIVVLYFYPKDDTPGCTLEAQAFNLLKPEFAKANAIIIGISKDNISSHNKFQDKYCLKFDLASDADSDTCERYGVWVEKSMYGKKYMGINRTTFLINQTGKIKHIWPKVSINGHAQEVLDFCKTL
ncbi:thioredoxin-dependent thiol peroxidase [Candidatus Trichorickettsia mobilis]|jgi:peroxiredoxin Q/BCP|uniref:thioredoxin-dependent thiol peroxidase n=1 Tax=Candidatus Trichorickettsia mobilis TaxID=1346319 RepID=UPI00292ED2F7|nr:thioredoxin-dependent thiol peroxidase [Candidatus Trichorickettsia mobilis]